MADRPQDRPKAFAGGVSVPGQASATRAEDVIAYLREHPDFLGSHPDALSLLRAPSRETGDGVVDFQHFMLERFRHDLGRLQHEQKNLIALSRGNLASQCRVHKATVAMLNATSFEHL